MAVRNDEATTVDEVRCSYHPGVTTRLRCSRCGKPICPSCGVRTPVGLRCPDCAGVRGLPTYATQSNVLARAAAAGSGLALVVGVVWGFLPDWGFYLALGLGFGVAELMAYLANNKRGIDLQIVGMVAVLLGLIVSRALLARQFGVDLGEVNQLNPRVLNQLRLNIIPDLVFAALPFLIVWYRFR